MPDNIFNAFARGMMDPGGLEEERIGISRRQADTYRMQVEQQRREFKINAALLALKALPENAKERAGIINYLQDEGVGALAAGTYREPQTKTAQPGATLIPESAPGVMNFEEAYTVPDPHARLRAAEVGIKRQQLEFDREQADYQRELDFEKNQRLEADMLLRHSRDVNKQYVDERKLELDRKRLEQTGGQEEELNWAAITATPQDAPRYWSEIEKGVGLKARWGELAQKASALIFTKNIPFKDETDATDSLRRLNTTLKRVYVLNKRYPVAEQATLDDILIDTKSWLVRPERIRQRLTEIYDDAERIHLNSRAAADLAKRAGDNTLRREYLKNAVDSGRIMGMLGGGKHREARQGVETMVPVDAPEYNPYLGMSADQLNSIRYSRNLSRKQKEQLVEAMRQKQEERWR